MIIVVDKNGTRLRVNDSANWIPLVQTGIPNLSRADSEVEVKSDLLSVAYLRLVLQFAGMHCAVGGQIILNSTSGATKPYIDAIRRDVSLVYGDCVEMSSVSRTGRSSRTVYVKKSALPIEGYGNKGLTLGVISSGKNPSALSACLDSFMPHSSVIDEILVCGPASLSGVLEHYSKVRLLAFTESMTDLRPSICHKKNKIAQSATSENLLIIHERIRPTVRFAKVYRGMSPHFEVVGCVLKDVEGNRVHGWTFLPYHDHTGAARLGVRMSEIHHISPLHYVNGSVIFCKRDVYLQHPLDERLHWGEMEDNHWYQGLWLKGVSLTTVEDLVCSDFSDSFATNRRNRWMPSGYTLQHRWLPDGYHTLPQFLWFTFLVLIRYLFHYVLAAPFRQYRDPLANSKGRRK